MTVKLTIEQESKRRDVAAMFSRISGKYRFMNTIMTAGMHARWRRRTVALATGGLPSGPALDVATGTGDIAFELARPDNVRGVAALDFVPEMLELARTHNPGKRRKDILWTLGDALELPFCDDSFMCVTTGFAMRNVADLNSALREMARVVRPGGRVVILEMTPRTGTDLPTGLLRFYFRTVVPALGKILAGDRKAYEYLPRSVESFPDAASLAETMTRAGLTGVCWETVGCGMVAIHWGIK